MKEETQDLPYYPERTLLVGAAESIWSGSDAKINIEINISDRLIQCMSKYLPGRLISVFITDSDMRHIKRRHGLKETIQDQETITPNDFGNIPEVLNNFDSCEQTDTDKLGNKKFLLKKNIQGTVFLVTIQRGNRKLEIKTMWKKKSGASC